MIAPDFHKDLTGSLPAVQRVVRWLRNQPGIISARDVQADPDYFHKGDIEIGTVTGLSCIEVKCERYSSRRTPNLAIERYSNVYQQEKAGGPWQTAAQWYVHLYSDGLMVVMQREALTTWLTDTVLRRQYDTFAKWNERDGRAWLTIGHLIPRLDAQKMLGGHYKEHRI